MAAIIRADSLYEDPALERTVRIPDVGSVIFGMSAEGITARVKGTKIKLSLSWYKVVAAMGTPGNVPAFLEGKPVEFLRHQVTKVEVKKEKARKK